MRFKSVWVQPTDVFNERFQFYNDNYSNDEARLIKQWREYCIIL